MSFDPERPTGNEKSDPGRHCFKCGRSLGKMSEWKKMDTDAGPICYVCFNEAAGEAGEGSALRK